VSSFGHPIYEVDDSVESQFAGLVNWGGTVYGAGIADLQAYFTSVPIPDINKCPMLNGAGDFQYIWAGGTDKSCCIWRPSMAEMWEF
jgi:hypothetical protein